MDPNTPQHQPDEGESTVLKKKEHTSHHNSLHSPPSGLDAQTPLFHL